MTTGVLLIKALRIKTNNKHKTIIKLGLLGKIFINDDKALSNARVWTTPWPRISKQRTVINDVLLKPLNIAWGLRRLLLFSS